jgi:hypothetical protein
MGNGKFQKKIQNKKFQNKKFQNKNFQNKNLKFFREIFFSNFFWQSIFHILFGVCLQKFGGSRPAGLAVKGIRTNSTKRLSQIII